MSHRINPQPSESFNNCLFSMLFINSSIARNNAFAFKVSWLALVEGEPTKTFSNWRGGRDSNPRPSYPGTHLAGEPIQPLWHLPRKK